MNPETIIQTNRLGKRFKLYKTPADRAIEWLTFGRNQRHRAFWALQDISFSIQKGESLAIIGPNGAGKSTLLKLLTGVFTPTTGDYQVSGRVLSLLELGTGFNGELTGRQNLRRSAQLLDFPSDYLEDRLPEIEAFAELGDYFDRPFKFYSSGMRARLGFSLFVYLEPEVLILDEVLSVGDVFFQQKSFARMAELMAGDTTVIFVTHSVGLLPEFFPSTLVLNQGHLVFNGEIREGIKVYYELMQSPLPAEDSKRNDYSPSLHPLPQEEASLTSDDSTQPTSDLKNNAMPFWPESHAFLNLDKAKFSGGRKARCLGVALCDETGQACQAFEQGDWAYFYTEYEILNATGIALNNLVINNNRNILVYGKSTLQHHWPERPSPISPGDRLRFLNKVKLDLKPGEYTVKLGLTCMADNDYTRAADLNPDLLRAKTTALFEIDRLVAFSISLRRGKGLSLLHHGICNLPGEEEISIFHQNWTNQTYD
ncbi:MAG: ABC transporter ATP-binding protein [Chloroflexota bacterium]